MSSSRPGIRVEQAKSASGEPVAIARLVRRMRGGSQSSLVEGDDGRYYVAKLLGNPQGNRTLINELIAAQIISRFDVLLPSLKLLRFPNHLLADKQLHFVVDNKCLRPQGTLHLGSQVPVDPDKTAIFDFLPQALLPKTANMGDFATMFVIDKWLYQTDHRQTIFVRNRAARKPGYVAYFIDNGYSFDGMNWEFHDSPLHGLAFQREIYNGLDMADLTGRALEKVQSFSKEDLLATARAVPPEWFMGNDRDALDALLTDLWKRRLVLPKMIQRHLQHLGL